MRTLLAIESSCDETCAAVVRGREVLSSIVASQEGLHDRFGGVVPEIAARRHLETVDIVVAKALEAVGGSGAIDAVAVTRGPGLVGALLVGVANAKARAMAWDVPLVAVDHLSGHVASALIADPDLEPPFLCLLVSGGHTLLLDVLPGLEIRLLGTTRDDAAGEAFDKGARLLGLPMPGGPSIEKAAAGGNRTAVPFTPAMVHHDTLDTSFSGIKTALAVHLRKGVEPGADLAASYEHAIVQTLVANVRKGIARRRPEALAVVGGVAANTHLRELLAEVCANDVKLVTVPLKYCGDNAAMIGVAAGYYCDLEPDQARTIDAYASSPLFRSGSLLPKQPS